MGVLLSLSECHPSTACRTAAIDTNQTVPGPGSSPEPQSAPGEAGTVRVGGSGWSVSVRREGRAGQSDRRVAYAAEVEPIGRSEGWSVPHAGYEYSVRRPRQEKLLSDATSGTVVVWLPATMRYFEEAFVADRPRLRNAVGSRAAGGVGT